jgi:hypothetical protein
MSRILKFLGVACAALFLAGCATRYGPFDQWTRTGYKDSRVSPNSFQVAFNGDGQYSRNQTAHFAFLRCAELTLEHGYAFYKISHFAVGTSTTTRIEDRLGPAGLAPAYGTSTNFSVSVDIHCAYRSAGAGFINAMAQARAIRIKYKLPPGTSGSSESGAVTRQPMPPSAAHSASDQTASETDARPQAKTPPRSADPDDSIIRY